MKYDVSVVVPIYNVSKFIERCTKSLFDQTYSNIEYIFVNDCTKDNSLDILNSVIKQFPNREKNVKIINHEVNKGLAASRNTGVRNASGVYIVHIDSDDFVEKDMISEMYQTAISNNADIVVADFWLQWENQKKYVKQMFDKDKITNLKMLLNGRALPAVWNKLIKRNLYLENDIWAMEGVNFGEDYAVTPRLFYFAEKISKIDKAFVHYVKYNNNSYTTNMSDKNLQDIESVLFLLSEYFKKTPIYSHLKISLLEGQLMKKIEIIKNIDKNKRKLYFNKFPESNIVYSISNLGIIDRIVYKLTLRNYFFALDIFLFFYKRLFNIIQILKGRK